MNRNESNIAVRGVTQRKSVVLGVTAVWVMEPLLDGVPRFYWSELQSLLCDGRCAFQIGGLFSSKWQARLWCGYHGFEFVSGELLAKTPEVRRFCERSAMRRLRPLAEFSVQAYEGHRERCPDCRWNAAKGRGINFMEASYAA